MITVGLLYPPLHSSSHSAEWQAASECDPAPIPNPTYFAGLTFAGQVTKTKNYCTYAEVKYAYDHDIKILPIKMCEPETKPNQHTHISSAAPNLVRLLGGSYGNSTRFHAKLRSSGAGNGHRILYPTTAPVDHWGPTW